MSRSSILNLRLTPIGAMDRTAATDRGTDAHLASVYDQGAPSHLLDETRQDLKAESLTFQQICFPPSGPRTGLKSIAWTAVAAYLFK